MDDEKEIEKESFLVNFYRNNKVLIFILLFIIAFILIMKFVVNNNNGNNKTDDVQIVIEPRENITIGVGNTTTLKVIDAKENIKYYWTSSDSNVAVVDDNGVVKAIKKGNVKIVAYYIDNNGNKYSSEGKEITVIEGDSEVEIKSISFPNGSLYMPVNGTYEIGLMIEPANAKVAEKMFISSDERVATISDSGLIKTLHEGHTTIIATVNSKYKTSIDLYVNSEYNKAEIVITPVTLSFDVGTRKIKIGDSEKLNYTVTPSNADHSKIKWTSSDSNVVSVDQTGKITAKNEGKAIISISSINGKRDDMTVEVFSDVVAVKDITIPTDTINMEAGKTEEITPIVLPENASNMGLSYSSSDPNVVSVAVSNYGETAILSALQSGSATITIKSGAVEKKIIVNVTGNGNNSEIDDGGSNFPTTIKVRSNKNNLAKSYEEALNIPVPGAATVSITLSTGVGKIKYCINKYEEGECTPYIEKYSNENVLIPSNGIYVLRIIKYDYRDNEITSSSSNYIDGVLNYYINTLSNEQPKLYTVTNTYSNVAYAILNKAKVGDTVKVTVDEAGRYLDVCATTDTTCTPNIRVSSSYIITLNKPGTWRIYVIEYDKNGRKIGNTEVYCAYVPTNTTNAQVKASNMRVNNDTVNGKYLSVDVESNVSFNTTRFCYTVTNKNAVGTCSLDITSISVPLYGNEKIVRPKEVLKTYYNTFENVNKKTLIYYLSELDNIYKNSDTTKDVIFEFAVKSNNAYSQPIKLRIHMNSRSGNNSNWSVTEVK